MCYSNVYQMCRYLTAFYHNPHSSLLAWISSTAGVFIVILCFCFEPWAEKSPGCGGFCCSVLLVVWYTGYTTFYFPVLPSLISGECFIILRWISNQNCVQFQIVLLQCFLVSLLTCVFAPHWKLVHCYDRNSVLNQLNQQKISYHCNTRKHRTFVPILNGHQKYFPDIFLSAWSWSE